MDTKDNGGPAFPNPALADENFHAPYDMSGMSLRDYFAGQAIAGFSATIGEVASPLWYKMADDAYTLADAMLAARDAKGEIE